MQPGDFDRILLRFELLDGGLDAFIFRGPPHPAKVIVTGPVLGAAASPPAAGAADGVPGHRQPKTPGW